MDKYKPNRNTGRDRQRDAENERKAHLATIETSESVKEINVRVDTLVNDLNAERQEREQGDRKARRSTMGWNVVTLIIALLALVSDVIQNWDEIITFLKNLFK